MEGQRSQDLSQEFQRSLTLPPSRIFDTIIVGVVDQYRAFRTN